MPDEILPTNPQPTVAQSKTSDGKPTPVPQVATAMPTTVNPDPGPAYPNPSYPPSPGPGGPAGVFLQSTPKTTLGHEPPKPTTYPDPWPPNSKAQEVGPYRGEGPAVDAIKPGPIFAQPLPNPNGPGAPVPGGAIYQAGPETQPAPKNPT
jgi:hypothetical protein